MKFYVKYQQLMSAQQTTVEPNQCYCYNNV